MNSNPVSKGDYPEIPAAELGDRNPEAASIVLLLLGADRALDRLDAPLLAQIRTLAEYFPFEVWREAVLPHARKIRAWASVAPSALPRPFA